MLKEIIRKTDVTKLFNNGSKNIDITIRNRDGSIDGSYSILRNNKKYLAQVNKNKKEVIIKLLDLSQNSKVKEFKTKSFYISLENVSKFLDEVYFNSL